jgi:sarcosine oxidase subunit beta
MDRVFVSVRRREKFWLSWSPATSLPYGWHRSKPIVSLLQSVPYTLQAINILNRASDLKRASMKTDVVIIGGGIVGCATAYYLAKKGLQVVVLEKNAGVGLEASGRNAGGVRQHGRKAGLPLAMESVRLWASLAMELESNLEYVRSGNLNIAVEEQAVQGLEQDLAWEHAHGLNEVRMLTAEECRALAPGLTGWALAGKFCPTDGVANPMLVTPAFARAARRLGVKFRLNTPVTGLLQRGATVCGVRTEKEEFEAQAVVNSAGPWASRFAEQAGCPIPIGPGRSQLMVTERLPHQLVRQWVTVRGQGYMRPTISGNLVLGSGGRRNDNYSHEVDYANAAFQAKRWSLFFPWLKKLSIIRAFSGITEYTPDGEPYIGPVPGAPGLYVAAGFHGEGFCPGPVTGKILAELITGNESCVPLEPFRPDRYKQEMRAGSPVPVVVYPLENMFTWNPAAEIAPSRAG